MMAHYEDARLNPNNCGNRNDNNSELSSEQANTATRTANTSSHAAANTNLTANLPWAASRLANYACSYYSTLGHRRPECTLLPCKHCGVMGH